MKLLITGGTGFFGKSILRFIQISHLSNPKKDHIKVVVMSRDPQKFLQKFPEFRELPWLKFHQGNILEPLSFPVDTSFTDVLHAATDSLDIPGLTALHRFDQIVGGTRNALDFSLRVGAKRFLFTSSGAVYGPQPIGMKSIPESYFGSVDPLNIQNIYGLAKRQAELLCVLYANQFAIETKIARCFAFVGPDLPLNAHFAIGNFLRDALEKKEITVLGDGSPQRSYLYQDDLAEWLVAILRNGRSGVAYNVGSNQTISLKNLAELVRDVVAPNNTINIGAAKVDQVYRNLYIPDISRAQGELNLQISIPLAQAIRKTVEILKGKNEHS